MSNRLYLRELAISDEAEFLAAMQRSRSLHEPWMSSPLTSADFQEFYQRYHAVNQKCLLLLTEEDSIAGLFSLSDMVGGIFQNAYLGFAAVIDFAGKGYMSRGLQLLCNEAFENLQLHRLEANIQPENHHSRQLVERNGFRLEGLSKQYIQVNGQWRDFERWALTYEDWQAYLQTGTS